jgi:hypothetical protein
MDRFSLEIVLGVARSISSLGRFGRAVKGVASTFFSLKNLLRTGIFLQLGAQLKQALGGSLEMGTRLHTLKVEVQASLQSMGKDAFWTWNQLDTLIEKLSGITNVNIDEWLEISRLISLSRGLTKETADSMLVLAAGLKPLARDFRGLGRALIRAYEDPKTALIGLETYLVKFTEQEKEMVFWAKEHGHTQLYQDLITNKVGERVKAIIGMARSGAGAYQHMQGSIKDMTAQVNELFLHIMAPVFEWISIKVDSIRLTAKGSVTVAQEWRTKIIDFIEMIYEKVRYALYWVSTKIGNLIKDLEYMADLFSSFRGFNILKGTVNWADDKRPERGAREDPEDFMSWVDRTLRGEKPWSQTYVVSREQIMQRLSALYDFLNQSPQDVLAQIVGLYNQSMAAPAYVRPATGNLKLSFEAIPKKLNEAKTGMIDFENMMANSITNMVGMALDGMENVEQAFISMLKSILLQVIQSGLAKLLAGAATGGAAVPFLGIPGAPGGFLGGIGTPMSRQGMEQIANQIINPYNTKIEQVTPPNYNARLGGR